MIFFDTKIGYKCADCKNTTDTDYLYHSSNCPLGRFGCQYVNGVHYQHIMTKLADLEKRLIEIYHAPGMPGELMARAHFQTLNQ